MFPFTDFREVTVILLNLSRTCHEKQSKPFQFDKNSKTKEGSGTFQIIFIDSISSIQELVSSVNK